MTDYYELLSSLANDLDNMLSELCTTPPPPYDRLSDTELHNRSDAFLEPYLQGLGERQSSGVGAPSPSPPPVRTTPSILPATPSTRSNSRESLISSNGGSDASSEDSGDAYSASFDITLTEKMVLSHPIWFLPGIQRAGAFHLLQGKEEGCFVVRKSSQHDTMALSVRLPPDKGPYIEHYLIHYSDGKLGLETSENRFEDMGALIAHYASCCDELPVQLTLPKAIRECKSRQQLSSLALLGQEFWSYSPPASNASSPDADLVLNLNPLMSTFKAAEPSTPVNKEVKPMRPNTLNLASKIDPQNDNNNKIETLKTSLKDLGKTPPPPPPRWSKPSTPQNNFTVTTTVTFSMNSQQQQQQSPSSESPEIQCDPKRMSPEGQCTNTMSSRGSLRRSGLQQVMSPLSPASDPSSDALSPLGGSKGIRQSKRKHKVSRHYQESDIVDSPSMYCKSGLGDKISDYEDVWTNEPSLGRGKGLQSPDLLAHTGNVVNLNNNVLSPSEVSQRSLCSTPLSRSNSNSHSLSQQGVSQSSSNKTSQIQSPLTDSTALPSIPQSPDSTPQSPKQNSPFYAEPADSLSQLQNVPRRPFRPAPTIPMQQRHSNPPALHALKSPFDRDEDFQGLSSSVDNLSPKPRLLKKPEIKPVLPPSIKTKPNDSWQIDNGWKFMSSECDVNMDSSDQDYDSDWPQINMQLMESFQVFTPDQNERNTLQDLISERFPDIRTSEGSSVDERCRMSAYDNVEGSRIPKAPPSEISEVTEFSDPWMEGNQGEDELNEPVQVFNPRVASINRSKSFRDRLDPLLSAPRLQALRSREPSGPRTVGSTIRAYALELAQDKTTTFAQNIDNFIACTCESKETNPQVVMRNMRQFMSGMKNYLVKHGEKGFYKEIERERGMLKSTEFLNLDAILEGVMHKLVVKPLKDHLQKLFLDYYTKTGAIRLLADNIQYASTRPISELAIKKMNLPSESALQTISQYIKRLQTADSPLEKLEFLLAAIATIFNAVKTGQLTGSAKSTQLGADDFLPLFVWVLVKTNFVAAEIEADYMWGLLHPSLLSGEGGYYLTTLSSAIHVLKNFKESSEEKDTKNQLKNDSVLKVVVPDELHGSILTKTLPARPNMTTKEVCKIIAHKTRITNPQDYALYRLTDGEETLLMDNECPQEFMKMGKHTILAYKRIDAKIAWPKPEKLNI